MSRVVDVGTPEHLAGELQMAADLANVRSGWGNRKPYQDTANPRCHRCGSDHDVDYLIVAEGGERLLEELCCHDCRRYAVSAVRRALAPRGLAAA